MENSKDMINSIEKKQLIKRAIKSIRTDLEYSKKSKNDGDFRYSSFLLSGAENKARLLYDMLLITYEQWKILDDILFNVRVD